MQCRFYQRWAREHKPRWYFLSLTQPPGLCLPDDGGGEGGDDDGDGDGDGLVYHHERIVLKHRIHI